MTKVHTLSTNTHPFQYSAIYLDYTGCHYLEKDKLINVIKHLTTSVCIKANYDFVVIQKYLSK